MRDEGVSGLRAALVFTSAPAGLRTQSAGLCSTAQPSLPLLAPKSAEDAEAEKPRFLRCQGSEDWDPAASQGKVSGRGEE